MNQYPKPQLHINIAKVNKEYKQTTLSINEWLFSYQLLPNVYVA